jgi:elongation factor Ts
MAISAKDVMTLRNRTGVGMMECKKALEDTQGDMDKAVELLRQTLKGKMDERSDRAAAEGAIAVARDASGIAIIELVSETDFAARNDSFVDAAGKIAQLALKQPEGEITASPEIAALVDNLRITIKENISLRRGVKYGLSDGQKVGSYVHHTRKIGVIVQGEGALPDELLTGLSQHIAAATPTPLAVDRAGLPADQVQKQQEIAVQEAKDSGKPQQIAEKIAIGKLNKWVDDHTLLGQLYLRELESKKPVRDFLPKGTKITRFARFQMG